MRWLGSSIISFHWEIQPTVRASAKSTVNIEVGKPKGPQGNAGIEIHIRIKLAVNKILVAERHPLQFARHVKQRIILDAKLGENLMGGLLHDLGARIVILVNPVAETHEPDVASSCPSPFR